MRSLVISCCSSAILQSKSEKQRFGRGGATLRPLAFLFGKRKACENPTEARSIFAVRFPLCGVIVLAGRQPACVLCLAEQKSVAQIYLRFRSDFRRQKKTCVPFRGRTTHPDTSSFWILFLIKKKYRLRGERLLFFSEKEKRAKIRPKPEASLRSDFRSAALSSLPGASPPASSALQNKNLSRKSIFGSDQISAGKRKLMNRFRDAARTLTKNRLKYDGMWCMIKTPMIF